MRRINPYTNDEYICYRSGKNAQKSKLFTKKYEKINKM